MQNKLMTVKEAVKKYGLENVSKYYYDEKGNSYCLFNIKNLAASKVISVNINFLNNEATIYIIPED